MKEKKNQKISYSKIESFLKLNEIQEMALSLSPKPDFTAALRSEELKGKLFQLYQDKKESASIKTSSIALTPTALVSFVERGDFSLEKDKLEGDF